MQSGIFWQSLSINSENFQGKLSFSWFSTIILLFFYNIDLEHLVSRSSKGFTAFELLTAPQQFSNDNEKSLPQNKSSLDKKIIPPSVTQQVMVYCV